MSSIWFYLQTEAEEQGSWTVPWNEFCHVRKQEATWAVSNCSTIMTFYILYLFHCNCNCPQSRKNCLVLASLVEFWISHILLLAGS